MRQRRCELRGRGLARPTPGARRRSVAGGLAQRSRACDRRPIRQLIRGLLPHLIAIDPEPPVEREPAGGFACRGRAETRSWCRTYQSNSQATRCSSAAEVRDVRTSRPRRGRWDSHPQLQHFVGGGRPAHGSPCARRLVRPEPLRRRGRVLSAAPLVGPTPMFHDLPVLADFTPSIPPPEAAALSADGR